MQRIQSLTRYQKTLLVLLGAMLLIFTILYPILTKQEGYYFKDAFLLHHADADGTVYIGRLHRQKLTVAVTPDKAVIFQYKDKTYGPYTAHEDPSAVPDNKAAQNMTGVEILEKDRVFFRGGVLGDGKGHSQMYLFPEDGGMYGIGFSYRGNDGIERDYTGEPIDKWAPTALHILELMNDPELTHRGDGRLWFAGMFLSVVNIWSILFANEIFRRNMSWKIRNVETIEPSDWEIGSRYVAWTILTIAILAIYIIGLR